MSFNIYPASAQPSRRGGVQPPQSTPAGGSTPGPNSPGGSSAVESHECGYVNKGSYWDQKEPRPAEESVTIRFHRKRDGLTLRGARVAQARKVLTVDRRWTDDFALKLTFRGAHVAENVIKVDKWDPPPEREISRDC